MKGSLFYGASFPNIANEQQMLIEKKGVPTSIFEERMSLLVLYEEFFSELAELVDNPGNEQEEWTHEDTLERLGDTISIENMELRSLREQILALIAQINKQDTMTTHYLEHRGTLQLEKAKPSRRISVGVLDR